MKPAPPPRLLPRPRTAAWLFAGVAVFALINFWYRYFDVLARGSTEPFQVKLIEEITGVFGAALLLVPVVWITRTMLWRRIPWQRALLYHVPVFAAFAALHTALLWGSRSALFPLFGLGSYDYGVMPMRFLMELGVQLPSYALAVGATLAFENRRAANVREMRLARLEAELAAARLTNLEHQLRPHFLFNALNTVSSVMYDDLGRADRILNDLGQLLRRSLRTPDAQLVPLREELADLELYLGIARARFEERLDVRIDAAAETLAAAVPALLLQPLVENALHHGDRGDGVVLIVRVSAAAGGGRLTLHVVDNGPGTGDGALTDAPTGIGLANTRRRLELLYPGRHRFEFGNAPGGGFDVCIDVPIEVAEDAAEGEGLARQDWTVEGAGTVQRAGLAERAGLAGQPPAAVQAPSVGGGGS
jgi:two-component system, LytTR family, sensor kinase